MHKIDTVENTPLHTQAQTFVLLLATYLDTSKIDLFSANLCLLSIEQ